MKNIVLSVLVLALATIACATTPVDVPSTPTVDLQIINDALTKTQAAQANEPVAPVANTVTATAVLSEASPTDVPTNIPETNLTTTPATATNVPAESTPTIVPSATSPSGGSTLTPTLGVLTYGTLPPAVRYTEVTLINKSKAQAYISLQNHPTDGDVAILEYPVGKRVKILAPLGYYIYVAWVGGNKITGSFTLHKDNSVTITIFKDKVTIQ